MPPSGRLVIRRIQVGLMALCIGVCVSSQVLFAEEGQDIADSPVLLPPVLVQASRMQREGTGSLSLQEQSSGSSRLG